MALNKWMRFATAPMTLPTSWTLVINDFGWWQKNEQLVQDWIGSNGLDAKIDHQSMVIDFASGSDADWFSLVWNDARR